MMSHAATGRNASEDILPEEPDDLHTLYIKSNPRQPDENVHIAVTPSPSMLTSVNTTSFAVSGTVWRPKIPHLPPAGSSLCHRFSLKARALTRTTTASGIHLRCEKRIEVINTNTNFQLHQHAVTASKLLFAVRVSTARKNISVQRG